MGTIKTIISYRKQKPSEVLFMHTAKRVKDDIAFTRHLIKFFLYRNMGINGMTIERHLGRISGGFNHASVAHSLRTVDDQPEIFGKMVGDIEQLLKN